MKRKLLSVLLIAALTLTACSSSEVPVTQDSSVESNVSNTISEELAEKYQVTNSAIAVAWILRHPARIQTIVGTTNRNRLTDICKASEVNLTREEWYALYMAAGKVLP